MKIFISGGSKSGKSMLAQRLAKVMQKENRPLYYLATMIPKDGEDEARILRHRRERDGWGFTTVEITGGLLSTVGGCNLKGVFLLDSLTALLANQMFKQDGGIAPNAYLEIAADLAELLKRTEDAVIVSDYIYSDASLYDDLTEKYRYGLSYIDRTAAGICDVVIEAFYGDYIVHKGELPPVGGGWEYECD